MGKIKKLAALVKNYGPATAARLAFNKLMYSHYFQSRKASALVKKTLTEDLLEGQRGYKFNRQLKVSILTPVYNTDADMLKCVIDSVLAQTYSNLELCICDGSDEEHGYVGELCREYAAKDDRIIYQKLNSNMGIAENTNLCAGLGTGDYYGLLDHDDILHPSAVFKVVEAVNNHNADFIYTDEVTFSGDISNIISTNFKPDYSPDTLRANNYICHFTCFSRELFNSCRGFKSEYDGSQDHDLVLRLTAKASCIYHIPELLYFWRVHSGSVSEDISAKEYAVDAGKRAVKDNLEAWGYHVCVSSTDVYPTIYKIDYEIKNNPLVSIIILNNEHYSDLKRCIESIDKSTYNNYEIIILENNSQSADILNYYKELKSNNRIKIESLNEPFNYSRFNNYAVAKSHGEYLLLLNNDTEVIEPHWLEEMLMFAGRGDVGAVGARLFYGNNTLQHAGVVTGIGEDRIAVHAQAGLGAADYGYLDRIGFNQNVNAVTGACLMTSRHCYEEAGGMDEKLSVAYNDVDYCLKLRQKGYLNIYTPFATLYHYESASRGSDWDKNNRERLLKEVCYMKEKWGNSLQDPYYNRNFSLDRAYMLR